MANSPDTTNRGRALRAALHLAGSQGVHALTHGRVDAAAGLPAGSASNNFRTRAALIHATVDHLVETEQGVFGNGDRPTTVAELAQVLTDFVEDSSGPQRALAAARFAFFVEGFHDAHVRDALADGRARIETWAAQTLEALGFARPFAAANRILSYVDGAILHRLAFDDTFDSRDDLEALIRSCGDQPPAGIEPRQG